MKPYKNLNRDSGVVAYQIAENSITIKFQDGGIYAYTYAKPGWHKVEAMKKLAQKGAGLATYINRNVRENYARRIA